MTVENAVVGQIKIPAGPELDAQIAALLGWHKSKRKKDGTYGRWEKGAPGPECKEWSHRQNDNPPAFSEEIGWAWQVVEWLRGQGWIVRVQQMPDKCPFLAGSGWEGAPRTELAGSAACMLFRSPVGPLHAQRHVQALANNAPHAICLAALEAARQIEKAQEAAQP